MERTQTHTHGTTHTHTGLSSFVLLHPLLYHLQLFLPKLILKDSEMCWLTAFCRSSNLAKTNGSQVLGSITVCVWVVVTLGGRGEAGHCSEYITEMTRGHMASVQLQETVTLSVPLRWKRDNSSSSVKCNFLSVREAELSDEMWDGRGKHFKDCWLNCCLQLVCFQGYCWKMFLTQLHL